MSETIVVAVTWLTMREQCRSRHGFRDFGRVLTLSNVFYDNGRIYFVLTTFMYTFRLVVETLTPGSFAYTTPLQYLFLLVPNFEPLIGLLVDLFLIQLQQAATSSVRFDGDGRPLALESSTADPSESVGLLQFVRADVDSWAQSEPDEEGAGTEKPESVAQTVTDASTDDFAALDRALCTRPELPVAN
ncbi:uncharacterized protein TRAVEDRAFT_53532 [Trametes versicolor FP-101664 SS1]|uniref:uncharacterized protein n=1 Tax=Trametes versicolor (strain FP-101664) TaxID=717944 RepID=UPI000462214F|nr:uncharacterized protein TRAVEDRAFT_53532 [Trametes versicolor FP-101664 SS1]EIW53120.1 hypothetical protein TRAVEDRAFT_53532 [Trametes versicolor FP-101664 SS1]